MPSTRKTLTSLAILRRADIMRAGLCSLRSRARKAGVGDARRAGLRPRAPAFRPCTRQLRHDWLQLPRSERPTPWTAPAQSAR